MLSAVPVRIPADVVGVSFDGTARLHFHAERGIRAHAASLAVAVQLTSLSDGTVSGTISADGQGQVIFTGTSRRRSFVGVFADGEIRATVSPNGSSMHGTLREVWNGDIITGSFNVKLPKAESPNSARRTRAQTGASASASGSTGTQVLEGAPLNTSPSANDVEPAVPILLPVLGTSFTTPDGLNPNTTSAGISGAFGTGIGVSTTTGSGMTTTTTPTTANFNFSPNSGIVSISNTNLSFSPTSGLTPLSAPTSFSPSSGITTLGIPGLGI